MPFFSAAGIISGVWLGIDRFKQIFKLIANSDYPWYAAFLILALDIPKILLNVLPICILLACFLSFQKLSLQAEFTAMRSAGASYLRILRPVVLFGIIGIFLCFLLSELLLPLTAPYSENLFKHKVKSVKEIKAFTFTKHNADKDVEQIFYAKNIRGDDINNLVIVNFSEDGLINIYLAKEARWNTALHGWDLSKGNSSFINRGQMETGEGFNHLVDNFKDKFISAETNPLSLAYLYKKVQAMNLFEIWSLIDLHKKENIETSSLNSLKTNFHQRFAYPVTCLILAFIGAILGFSSRRESRNWNYISLGLIVFSFFMFQAIFSSFGDSGRIAASLAMWIPNFILALVSLLLFYIKAR